MYEFCQSEADQNAFRAAEEALTEAAFENPPGGFVSVKGYTNQQGEVSDYLVNGSASYEAVLARSIEQASRMSPENVVRGCPSCASIEGAQMAIDEVLASWAESLRRLQGGEGTRSNFEALAPGVSVLESEPGAVYVWGLLVSKRVRVAVEYRPVKSSPKTLTKRYIERLTPAAHFRRFKLTDASSFESIAMAGRVIRVEDLAGRVAR